MSLKATNRTKHIGVRVVNPHSTGFKNEQRLRQRPLASGAGNAAEIGPRESLPHSTSVDGRNQRHAGHHDQPALYPGNQRETHAGKRPAGRRCCPRGQVQRSERAAEAGLRPDPAAPARAPSAANSQAGGRR